MDHDVLKSRSDSWFERVVPSSKAKNEVIVIEQQKREGIIVVGSRKINFYSNLE